MFNINQINVVRKYMERRFNTVNVVYIRSGASGFLFTVNELEFTVNVDADYNVIMYYTKYGVRHSVKGGYSLGLLENDLKDAEMYA